MKRWQKNIINMVNVELNIVCILNSILEMYFYVFNQKMYHFIKNFHENIEIRSWVYTVQPLLNGYNLLDIYFQIGLR